MAGLQLAGSDSSAIGGDLASYRHGGNGTLAGVGVTPAVDTLYAVALGASAQALSRLAVLQVGSVRLS